MKDLQKPERLAKRIANAGVCSRRQAEALITAGEVQVNGKTVDTPAFTVTMADIVVVQGKELSGETSALRLFRFHKPKGCLCTTSDPQGRPTIFSHLPPNLPRVLTIGRLDFNSEGLLLLTTDGELAQEWMRSSLPRVYRVRVHGKLDGAAIQKLERGLRLKNAFYKPMKIELETVDKKGENLWYKFTITEGKNREIRNAVEAVGGQVTRLIRIAYGPAELADLGRGHVVEVPRHQLKKWQTDT